MATLARTRVDSMLMQGRAQVNIEMAHISNNINRTMRTLTLATTMVLPLSLISGIWGMNVKVPGQVSEEDDLVAFFMIVLFMFGAWVAMFIYFRRSRVF